jgi:hypothetical protein
MPQSSGRSLAGLSRITTVRDPRWQAFDDAARASLAGEPAEKALRAFVELVDRTYADGESQCAWATESVTRALVALGGALMDTYPGHPGIQATLEAAQRLLDEPSEANELAYFDAATASYPFGAGEGCYSILPPEEPHDRPGNGCRSGAGSIYWIGQEIGWDVAVSRLRASRGTVP